MHGGFTSGWQGYLSVATVAVLRMRSIYLQSSPLDFYLIVQALPSLALGTNSSAMTAIGNDYGYENVFAREIQAIATPADVLIAITTSGNSGNILKALEAAKEANVPSVVLTGAGRGMLDAATETLNIPSTDTARIQECHILLGHIICGLVEESIFGSLRAENA